MKKKILLVAVLAATLALPSCIGSFGLSNKLLSWNRSISNKFVNELVFIAFWIVPVYEISGLADMVVLNSIEFWTGDNPVKSGISMIKGQDGTPYRIECDPTGYTITNTLDGSVARLNFDNDTREWSVTDSYGNKALLFGWVDSDHVRMANPKGGYTVVPLTNEGLYAYTNAVTSTTLAAR